MNRKSEGIFRIFGGLIRRAEGGKRKSKEKWSGPI